MEFIIIEWSTVNKNSQVKSTTFPFPTLRYTSETIDIVRFGGFISPSITRIINRRHHPGMVVACPVSGFNENRSEYDKFG